MDWVPIDLEENADYERGGEVEVTSEGLLSESYGDIGWWLFVLEKHPSRAVKCGIADWYMKQGGEDNRKRALKLLEESAQEGFGFARQKLAAWQEVCGALGDRALPVSPSRRMRIS